MLCVVIVAQSAAFFSSYSLSPSVLKCFIFQWAQLIFLWNAQRKCNCLSSHELNKFNCNFHSYMYMICLHLLTTIIHIWECNKSIRSTDLNQFINWLVNVIDGHGHGKYILFTITYYISTVLESINLLEINFKSKF